MQKSGNLQLNLITNSAEDTAMTFQEYRNAIAGATATSNMQVIDEAYGEMDERVFDLENPDSVVLGDDITLTTAAVPGKKYKYLDIRQCDGISLIWSDPVDPEEPDVEPPANAVSISIDQIRALLDLMTTLNSSGVSTLTASEISAIRALISGETPAETPAESGGGNSGGGEGDEEPAEVPA